MFNNKNRMDEKLLYQLIKINNKLNESKISEIAETLGNSKKMLLRNFASGIANGIGSGIGFYIITAVIIYIIQKIIKLNIPGISQYIADIVEIVQNSK